MDNGIASRSQRLFPCRLVSPQVRGRIRAMKTLLLLLALVAQATSPQAEKVSSPSVEAHIQDLVKELPSGSALRESLLHGALGNGLHYAWMDEMRKLGVKRAVVSFDIRFDRKGRPKQITSKRTEYFTQYEDGRPISDEKQLDAIRTSGLDKELNSFAQEKAKHGFWIVDVPRPRPKPFIGGADVELFDDEWIPGPSGPRYYTR